MGQRLVAAHQVMLDCLALPECIEDFDRPGHSVVDADVMARSHLIAMFPVTDYVAEAMLSLAADLHFRYPAILKAMLDGRMDLAAAKVLAEQMSTVDDEFVLRVQQEVVDDYLDAVESGKRPTRKAIRSRIDEIISRRDRAAVRERKADAGRDRGVSISKGRDGMSSLYAQLRADEAAVLAEALENKVAADKAAEDAAAEAEAAAEAAHTSGASDTTSGAQPGQPGRDGDEPYSHKQRMADALMSFVCGDATTGDTDSDSGAASGNASDTTGTGTGTGTDTDTSTGSDAGTGTGTGTDTGAGAASAAAAGGSAGSVVLRPKVTIIAPAGRGRWFDRAHVEFARSGEAALLAVLEMFAASDAASIQYLDPAAGVADDPDQALRYRPGTALATRIRMRDGSCRHPGCTVKIEACDL
ncbi:13E12 repeat family protein, partial [Dietzia sp. NCCP-2495]|uniref:13E12 repeat family protein n=1 Tax=Dietzia sp. NCCP-2495 TaxID=2934675 RepID=UPI00222F8091